MLSGGNGSYEPVRTGAARSVGKEGRWIQTNSRCTLSSSAGRSTSTHLSDPLVGRHCCGVRFHPGVCIPTIHAHSPIMSTEFRIGMSDGRNSSRVLKPPGGGHSQIFGGPEEEAPRKNHKKSEISSCFGTEAPTITTTNEEKADPEKDVKEHEQNTTNGNNDHADANTNGVSKPEANNVVESKNELNGDSKPQTTPERKRIPPGGYSSGGFW